MPPIIPPVIRIGSKKIRIIFRGDSGFFDGALIDFLEARGHGYLIKVKLKGLVELLEGKKWTAVSGHPDWEQCEFEHACKGWKRARRFVAVRIEKEDKEVKKKKKSQKEETRYDYFCYVLSENFTPWQTHKKSSCCKFSRDKLL